MLLDGNEVVTSSLIAKRLVFHIGGYDPVTPNETAFARFSRELRRFERTWSVQCSVSSSKSSASDDEAKWNIITNGPNWQVQTEFHLVRWDDVISSFGREPLWRRLSKGMGAFFSFVSMGALTGYFRTNWRYGFFFLYPFFVLWAFISGACLAGALSAGASGSIVIGAGVTFGTIALFFLGPWQWLHLAPLFDDWIFSHGYIHSENPLLRQRLDNISKVVVEAARLSSANEILIIGHSLGAVLAIDLLHRALKNGGLVDESNSRISFISIGSSVLKIGLHRGADQFRQAAQRVAHSPGIFWADYQARVDVMNFYDTDPMREMDLETMGKPVVKLVEISQMLDRIIYRRIRLRFFRLHCQFISGNDRRAAYDYFMLVCGPVSCKCQALAPDGAVKMLDGNGALLEIASQKTD